MDQTRNFVRKPRLWLPAASPFIAGGGDLYFLPQVSFIPSTFCHSAKFSGRNLSRAEQENFVSPQAAQICQTARLPSQCYIKSKSHVGCSRPACIPWEGLYSIVLVTTARPWALGQETPNCRQDAETGTHQLFRTSADVLDHWQRPANFFVKLETVSGAMCIRG